MFKKLTAAVLALSAAISLASAAFADSITVTDYVDGSTAFTLAATASEGSTLGKDTITLNEVYSGDDTSGEKKTPESYLTYTAPADGTLSITFMGNGTNGKNFPRLYWADASAYSPTGTAGDLTTLSKKSIASGDSTKGGIMVQTTAANTAVTNTLSVTKGTTYYLFGYLYSKTVTFTLTNFKFTSTADATTAAAFETNSNYTTEQGYTVDFTTASGTSYTGINWYGKTDSSAYATILSDSVEITGGEGTTYQAGLIVTGLASAEDLSSYSFAAALE